MKSKSAIRPKRVSNVLDCSIASVWRWVKTDPTFPKPFKLGPNSTAFDALEVENWLKARQEAARFANVPAVLPANVARGCQ